MDDDEDNDSADEEEEEFDGNDWRNEDSQAETKNSGSEAESSDDDDEYQDLEKMAKNKKTAHGSDDDEDGGEEEDDDEEAILTNSLSWKENLAEKARDAFLQRHSESKNLMRLVYGCYLQSERKKNAEEGSDHGEESESDDDIGGLFKVAAKKQTQMQKDKDMKDKEESCFFADNFGKNTQQTH